MHPYLDLVDQLLRIFGWPALLTALAWTIRKWDKSQRQFQEIDKNTKVAVEAVAQVQDQVNRIETNHLVHLQEGITRVAASNDKAVEVLNEIRTGIEVLVDRTPRNPTV
jgi:hypothetical protein